MATDTGTSKVTVAFEDRGIEVSVFDGDEGLVDRVLFEWDEVESMKGPYKQTFLV